MAAAYRLTFAGLRRSAVDVTVPDDVEPLEHIAQEVARELDLMRFEVQIGDDGGHIRAIGADGPCIAFSFAPFTSKDS